MKIIRRKLVIVGDSGVGKTSLLTVVATGRFPADYTPLIYGGLVMDVYLDKTKTMVELGFWDTANGEGDYDRLRPLNYPDSGIIVICFSMDNPKSLENVTARWYPEVAHFAQGVPILLLGCKMDLCPAQERREGSDSLVKGRVEEVRKEQARAVAKAIGAVRYLECSALRNQGVREFLQASGEIAASWDPPLYRRRHTPCQIL